MGYRIKANDNINFDITGYFFDYDDLLAENFGPANPPFFPPPPVGTLITIPTSNRNTVEGEVYGVEVSGQWKVRPNWRLSASYTYANTQLHPKPGSAADADAFQEGFEAEGEPEHIFNVRSYFNLSHNLEFDTFYYYVSENNSRSIPAYSRLDIRLGWQPMDNVDLSFTAQNLLDPSHPELSELLEVASETQRSYYVKVTLRF